MINSTFILGRQKTNQTRLQSQKIKALEGIAYLLTRQKGKGIKIVKKSITKTNENTKISQKSHTSGTKIIEIFEQQCIDIANIATHAILRLWRYTDGP